MESGQNARCSPTCIGRCVSPRVGWGQTGDNRLKNYPVTPNLSLPFRHFEFRHGAGDQPTQQIAHAFYCLWGGSRSERLRQRPIAAIGECAFSLDP